MACILIGPFIAAVAVGSLTLKLSQARKLNLAEQNQCLLEAVKDMTFYNDL